MCVNGDTGNVESNISVEPQITTKLLDEALNCPIAFTELVRQFGALSTDDQNTWLESLTGGQAAALYFASVMHSDGIGGLILLMAGLDGAVATTMVIATMKHIGRVFDFTVEEGGSIPQAVRDAAMEYALVVEANS